MSSSQGHRHHSVTKTGPAMTDIPSYRGIPLKHISLVTLTIQNSALTLIMHYSRIMPGFQDKRYFASTAVLCNEMIKSVICLLLVWREQKRLLGESFTIVQALRATFTSEIWKLAIPAGLYTYVAVSNLDAATFQVTYQLKIITTAIFTVTILRRQISLLKWISLVLLTGGIALVQLPVKSDRPVISTAYQHDMDRRTGLLAVICTCTLSGLAGVYFEKVLKGSKNSLWALNLQLSFFSLFPALFLGVLWKDSVGIAEHGFFYGYNYVVWAAIMTQAAGGLIVAMCVAYADNIMKTFATSVSILISAVASAYLFDFVISRNFVVGAAVVLGATYLYGLPDQSQKGVSPGTTNQTPLDASFDNDDERIVAESLLSKQERDDYSFKEQKQ